MGADGAIALLRITQLSGTIRINVSPAENLRVSLYLALVVGHVCNPRDCRTPGIAYSHCSGWRVGLCGNGCFRIHYIANI
jgi:hypothetical protein